MRGFGLPGCGRGVVVPISMKPKPSASSARRCARRSCPARRQGRPGSGRSGRRPWSAAAWARSPAAGSVRCGKRLPSTPPRPCARSASKANRKGGRVRTRAAGQSWPLMPSQPSSTASPPKNSTTAATASTHSTTLIQPSTRPARWPCRRLPACRCCAWISLARHVAADHRDHAGDERHQDPAEDAGDQAGHRQRAGAGGRRGRCACRDGWWRGGSRWSWRSRRVTGRT